jgi:hypothetical protein
LGAYLDFQLPIPQFPDFYLVIPGLITTIMTIPIVERAGSHNDQLAISNSPSAPNAIRDGKAAESEANNELPRPVTAAEALQRWNKPRINVWRFLVTNLCFTLMGSNDGAVGVRISLSLTWEIWLIRSRRLFHMYERESSKWLSR